MNLRNKKNIDDWKKSPVFEKPKNLVGFTNLLEQM